jgi:hypothetical protein
MVLPSPVARPARHFSALFHDLDPGTNATVSWKQFSDHVAVTWQNIPEYGVIPSNNFQAEMFFDGRIRVTYLDLNCLNNLVGLSAGHGTPAAFAQMDFANFGPCPTPPPANMDHFAFSHIPSPQAVNVPFTVQIEAQDGTNNPVADFHNAVTISGGLGFKPIKVTNFVQGVWSGTIVVTQASGTFVLQADDGYGHLGFSTPIAIGQSLQIQSEIDAGVMTLRWPAGAPGLILEKTPSLSAPTWTPAGVPVLLGDQYEFRINTAQPKEFFRLHSVGP